MNLEPFSLILQKASGLTLRNAGNTAALNFIQERMNALGLTQPEDYQQRLEQDTEERQRLIEATAVLETSFNRDPVAFETLAKLAKERLKKDPAPLRILCLPCSTGEEAYSIVAALVEAGLTPDQFSVDAVDISGAALTAAQTGDYKAPAFRKCPEEFRQKHFTPVSDDTWRLTAEWKSLVKFRQGNLLQIETVLSDAPYDFIFNRNLLIYFARPDQAKALGHLRQLLKPDGIIFVAAGEGGIFLANGFRTLRIPHAFAFRQAPPRQEPKSKPQGEAQPETGGGSEGNPSEAPARAEAGEEPAATAPRGRAAADAGSRQPAKPAPDAENPQPEEAAAQEAADGESQKPEPRQPKGKQRQPQQAQKQHSQKEPQAPRRAASPEDTVSIMEDIKELADAGGLAEAEGKLRGLLAGGSSDADSHYLMGLLQDAQGDTTKAMATYRRVIQLDSNHQDALKMLIELTEAQGDKAELEKLQARLHRLQHRSQPRRAPKADPNPPSKSEANPS